MEEDIINYIKQLNEYDIFPEYYFRTNSVFYRYISLINFTIALYISKNNNNLVLFIWRARKEKKYLIKENLIEEENVKYLNLCDKYLDLLTEEIESSGLVENENLLKLLHSEN